jgi:hypothetical protein
MLEWARPLHVFIGHPIYQIFILFIINLYILIRALKYLNDVIILN